MAVYNLEETPNIFIFIGFYNNKFIYQMTQVDGDDNRKKIRSIDLRNDKLRIYGKEIEESMFQKLFDSLTLREKAGAILVNCDGACYIMEHEKPASLLRPINNVIFDWSPFGVIVPNSLNDLLTKELKQKDVKINDLNQELASSKATLKGLQDEVSSSKDERRKMEVEVEKVNDELSLVSSKFHEIQEQVLGYESVKKDMEVKLQKACEKIALVDFELDLYKIELESCKKEVDQLLDELCNCKEESAKMEVELHKMQGLCSSQASKNRDLEMESKVLENELSLVRSELQSSKDEVGICIEKKKTVEVELQKIQDQLSYETSSFNKRNQEFEMVSKTLEDELSLVRSELKSTKDSSTKENKRMEAVVQKMENELSLIRSELQTTKDQLESSNKHTDEVDERLINCENERQGIEKEFEKMQDQLCMANKEVEGTMILLESLRKEIQELKEQIRCYEKEDQLQKSWCNMLITRLICR